MNTLAQLLSSRTRAEIFRLLFGMQSAPLHLRALERGSGVTVASVRQELGKLERLGMVARRRDGNRTYYTAQTGHPLYSDIRGLVLKTSGLVELLQKALSTDGIACAFVFGSLASGTATPDSDVDLFVVGSLGLRRVTALLSGLGHRLGREINPHIFSVAEFARRRDAREHFVGNVLAAPKLFVIGSDHDLATLGT